MKMQWNKVTWYSKAVAVVLGLGIFALGIYIGVVYQKGRDALDWAEQLRIDRPIPLLEEVTVRKTEKSYAYVQEGNIKNNATGEAEVDEWVLIYNKPGASGMTVGLTFTTDSRCVADERVELCNTKNFEQGQRVRIMGHPDTDKKIIVERLEVVR